MLLDAPQTGVRTEPAADTVCDHQFIYRGVRKCFRHDRSNFHCFKARIMYIISSISSQEDCVQNAGFIRPIPGTMATIEKIQSALHDRFHDRFIDGWFCLRSPLPRCNRLSGSRASGFSVVSRRWFCLAPAYGVQVKLLHQIESLRLDRVRQETIEFAQPGETLWTNCGTCYRKWTTWRGISPRTT